MNRRLLAKSRPATARATESVYLSGHLRDVFEAGEALLVSTGPQQLQALGLSPGDWLSRLRRAVLLGAATHDLGKANDHFQGMLEPAAWPSRKNRQQGLRHEWVTFFMLTSSSLALGQWLEAAAGEDPLVWHAAIWAASGHHPAYNRPSPPTSAVNGAGSIMKLLLDHPEFARCLEWIADQFGLSSPPRLDHQIVALTGSDNVFCDIVHNHKTTNRFWEQLNDEERRFVAAVKDCLVAADVAGSALPKQIDSPAKRHEWIEEAFGRVPGPHDIRQIIDDRLTDSEGRRHELRPFQKEVAEASGEVILVKAGCGTGKTLAAYHWAACRCPGKRLYLCYPTTGTATEGFRDYLVSGEAARFHARLFHGRASVDLDMLGVREDASDDTELAARIESLDAWSTPIVSCTVDTVLGLIQNNRRALFAWPALAGSAFVFDEIHAYDDRLFGALLRFLKALPGVPVLLMTASLPECRLEALREVLNGRLGEVEGPRELEALPRYHRHDVGDAAELMTVVADELKHGGKVLWVTNTVGRALEAAELAADLRPILYHSRFRYEDRVRQHARVIDAFDPEKNPGAALAICTQVAEMSLDLSATLLVTDLAPVPSLIQRLGRLNRRATPPTSPDQASPPTRPFTVIEPTNRDGTPATLPYTPAELEVARRWLEMLPADGISQADLARTWEAHDDARSRKVLPAYSAWLDEGPVTKVLELREASPGITVLLAEDLPALVDPDSARRKSVAEVALPMPPPPSELRWRQWNRFRGIPVAPEGTVDYDRERGAQWK